MVRNLLEQTARSIADEHHIFVVNLTAQLAHNVHRRYLGILKKQVETGVYGANSTHSTGNLLRRQRVYEKDVRRKSSFHTPWTIITEATPKSSPPLTHSVQPIRQYHRIGKPSIYQSTMQLSAILLTPVLLCIGGSAMPMVPSKSTYLA